MDELAKDLLVTTYGVVLAVIVQELVGYLKKRASRKQPKHPKKP